MELFRWLGRVEEGRGGRKMEDGGEKAEHLEEEEGGEKGRQKLYL